MSEQDIETLAQDRLLSNIAVMGRVVATEFAKETGLVRVRIGPEKEKGAEYDMPWIRKRGGNDWEWWAPEVKEQVLIISPDGDLDRAIIVGSLPYKDFADSLTPSEKDKRWVLPKGGEEPPKEDKKKDESTAHVIHYKDETTTLYDKELHIFQATFLKDKTIDLKVDAKEGEEKAELKFNKDKKDKISIIADATDDKENIQIKFKEGDTEKVSIIADATKDKNKVSIKAQKVIVDIDATKDAEKVSIDVNGETNLEMDAKGEIKVKAKDITMTLDKDGGVTVKCKTLTFTSEKDVEVKSTAGAVNITASKNVVLKGAEIHLNN